ncbi:MAG TPA: pYEATS domain-containing protein [Chitinophagaceae bacterium]|nr:pYEATS domain-containing protein [Chitinophagaceae bacterium]
MDKTNNKYKIAQDYKYEGEDWWNWQVWIEGNKDDMDEIAHVVYTLHPTFINPVRKIDDRESKFRLEEEGWGGFTIYAKIVLKNEKSISLEHELTMKYPDGKENVQFEQSASKAFTNSDFQSYSLQSKRSAGLPNQFNDIIQKHLNVFAAWMPIVNKYSLGDYGVFSDGIFSKFGNISEDFQVSFKESSGPGASIDFTSAGVTVTKVGANAGVNTAGADEIKASVQIEFKNEKSLLIQSPTVTVATIENVNEVSNKLIATGKWDGQWKVVFQVYNALDALIISTIEAGTRLDFSGDATAIGQMKLGSAGVNIDTNKTLGLKISGKSGVIGLGLFRIKSKIFGGQKVEILGGESKWGDNKSYIKLDAKDPIKDDV